MCQRAIVSRGCEGGAGEQETEGVDELYSGDDCEEARANVAYARMAVAAVVCNVFELDVQA